jgi:hypothetical protein
MGMRSIFESRTEEITGVSKYFVVRSYIICRILKLLLLILIVEILKG